MGTCIIVALRLPLARCFAAAPNAIVFGHSTMTTADMMKAGFVMNIICVFTLCVSINTYAIPLFNLGTFPDWAAATHPNITMCDT